MSKNVQLAFSISRMDNVATALDDLAAGTVIISGESDITEIMISEPVRAGHKVALRDIGAGEGIIKYAIPIGCAVSDISKGDWVHLQNMKSQYDARSSTLDAETGAPSDMAYE